METIAMSPVPQSDGLQDDKILMNFFLALRQTLDGKRMSRVEWQNANVYGFIKQEKENVRESEILYIKLADGSEHRWILNTGDLHAEDWFVLD